MPYEKIKLETALMPAYYKDFRCLAAACQDTCCTGWKIEFDKKDYLAIKRAARTEELKAALAQGMPRLRQQEHDRMYAEFTMSEAGRCHLQREDGLCALQLECGPDVLPRVCRLFPRRRAYTPYACEFSLSPACEGVINLLWDLPEGIDFIEEPLHPRDVRYYQPSNAAAARFAPIRSLFIDVLQARAMRLPQRLLLLGLLAQQLRELDWDNLEALDAWLEQAVVALHTPAVAAQLNQLPHDRTLFLANGLHVLLAAFSRENQALRDELLEALDENHQRQDLNHFNIENNRYQPLSEQLDELLGHSEHLLENLMVTLAFHLHFPALNSPEELWKSYVNLCNLYSLYRFAAVCACQKEVSRARLTHVLVQISRTVLHNNTRQSRLRDELFKNDSATLAHMAILVGE